MKKPRIYLQNNPTAFTQELLIGGKWMLDFNADFSLSLSKSIGEYKEFTGIKTDGVLNDSLPYTHRNNAAMHFFTDPTILDNDFEPIPIRINVGSTYFLEDELLPLETNDIDRQYEVQFQKSSEHWTKKLKNCLLSDLDLGTFVFTALNIDDNWLNNSSYDGTNDIVHFPPINYGAFTSGATANYEDLRPLFSVWGLLEKMFCEANLTVKSPFLESEYGRRKWLYILRKDFNTFTDVGQQINWRASRTPNQTITGTSPGTYGTVILNNDSTAPNSDVGGNFNTGTGEYVFGYTSPLTIAGKAVGQLTINDANDIQIIARVVLTSSGGAVIDFEERRIITSNAAGGFFNVNMPYSFSNVESTNKIFVEVAAYNYVTLTTEPVTVIDGFYLSGNVVGNNLLLGDTLTLSDVIENEITCYELLEAIVHENNLKVSENKVTGEVTLDIPYAKEVETDITETVTGFFKPLSEAIDLTEKVICNSRIITTSKSKLNRYLRLEFAKSNDAYIDSLNLTDDTPLWGRTLDLGDGLNEGTDVITNPLFEPTGDVLTDLGGAVEVSLPAMWDNEEGEISFDIGPRSLMSFGMGTQYVGVAGGSAVRSMIFANTEITSYPITSQHRQVFDNTAFPAEMNNIFGSVYSDLYQRCYREELLERLNSQQIQFLVMLSFQDFLQIDFKTLFRIQYKGKPAYYRGQSITDFQVCKGIPTPMNLIPVSQRTDDCIAAPVDPPTLRCDICWTSPDPTGSNVLFTNGAGAGSLGTLPDYSDPTEAGQLIIDIQNWLTTNGYTYDMVEVQATASQIFDICIYNTTYQMGSLEIGFIYEDFGLQAPVNSNCVEEETDRLCTLQWNGVLTQNNCYLELADGTNIGLIGGYTGAQINTARNDLRNHAIGLGYTVGASSGGVNGAGAIDFITFSNTNVSPNFYRLRWDSVGAGSNPLYGVLSSCVVT